MKIWLSRGDFSTFYWIYFRLVKYLKYCSLEFMRKLKGRGEVFRFGSRERKIHFLFLDAQASHVPILSLTQSVSQRHLGSQVSSTSIGILKYWNVEILEYWNIKFWVSPKFDNFLGVPLSWFDQSKVLSIVSGQRFYRYLYKIWCKSKRW